jgi:hypothetical protein
MNLCAGPGTNDAVAGSAKAGQPLEIVGKNKPGTWRQVCIVAKKPAWLSSALVTVQGEAAGVSAPAIIPSPPPKPTARAGSDLMPLARDKAQQTMAKVMDAVDGVSMVIAMDLPLPVLEGAVLFTYHTEISRGGQTQEFMAQLRPAVLAALPGFARAAPPRERLVIWPTPADRGGHITINGQSALDWYTGKLTGDAFMKSWKVELE